MGFGNVHTPGPAEKVGKSSKSMIKSADALPHEEVVVVAAVLEAVDVSDNNSELVGEGPTVVVGSVGELDTVCTGPEKEVAWRRVS